MVKNLLLAAGLLLLYMDGFSWGFYAHKLVNRHAVFLLPPEMMVLYKPYIEYLSEHSVDPDKRRYALEVEGARHYIDLDKYDRQFFRSFEVSWKSALEQFPEDTLNARGIVPWWIQVMLGRLSAAFRDMNVDRVLKISAELGHYVSDAHVPLHASSNHNGQHTGQHGIHGFWESRIPELYAEKEWDFWLGKAGYLSNPLKFTWMTVLESSAAADTVLMFERMLHNRFPPEGKYAFEERNGLLIKQYSSAYAYEYNNILNGMVERRLRQSIGAVAAFWYTAWVNAGQPDCSKMLNKGRDSVDADELDELNRKWKEGEIKGKSCIGDG